jgi:hypothetical protein
MPEDAVVAALDNDELQLGIHLTGEIPPLSTGGLWSVNGIDNDIVPRASCSAARAATTRYAAWCVGADWLTPARHIAASA